MRWLATWLVAMALTAAAVDRRPDLARRTWPPTSDALRFNPTIARRGLDPATAWRGCVVVAKLATRSPADPLVWAAVLEAARQVRR